MKYLLIIVEGQTEQEFVNEILREYLVNRGVPCVSARLIRTSRNGRGGFVNFDHLKKDITKILNSEKDAMVTTFVDYFRCPTNMPGYDEAMAMLNHAQSADMLEQHLERCFKNPRFIPYIQLHEFEALLYSSNKGFEAYWTEEQSKKTEAIVKQFADPETINSKPETAPSKRLLKIKEDYDKVAEGNLIALEVGIEEMLERCRRFKAWTDKIIANFNLPASDQEQNL